jgi:hypothetical protein
MQPTNFDKRSAKLITLEIMERYGGLLALSKGIFETWDVKMFLSYFGV